MYLKRSIFINSVKEIRLSKYLSINGLAKVLNTNTTTDANVERVDCRVETYLTVIRKMSLQFEDIDDAKLIRNYEKWLENN